MLQEIGTCNKATVPRPLASHKSNSFIETGVSEAKHLHDFGSLAVFCSAPEPSCAML